MYPRDTIAAVATPPGPGGIGIVRVSGPDARAVARRLCPALPANARTHRLYAVPLVDADGRRLDRVLCVLMLAPGSYTGEDVAEIHCHGGVLLVRAVLAAALAAGARAAERGEFTLRAFLNGKLDLAQAESVADLVAARTPEALRVASAQLEGALSRETESIREELLAVAARLEVHIDFAEDDVGALDRAALVRSLEACRGRVAALAATYRRGRVLREGARVAIVGKPNVGKSSLLNRLLRTERAIVTAVPGTTRDVIEETIDVGGVPVVLADTAGVRDGADEVERLGIERTRRAVVGADLLLVVLDASRPLDDDDLRVLDATQHKKRILLMNKADLPFQWSDRELYPEPGPKPVPTSMTSGAGLDEVLAGIARELSGADDGGSLVITRERHFQALRSTEESLVAAGGSLSGGHPPDIVAVDVMAAIDALGEIVGRLSPEAVLDRIFSEFCIGK